MLLLLSLIPLSSVTPALSILAGSPAPGHAVLQRPAGYGPHGSDRPGGRQRERFQHKCKKRPEAAISKY